MVDLETAATSIEAESARSAGVLRSHTDWSAPTRLAGWSVADLAGHLVWGQALQADAWSRLLAGDPGMAEVAPMGDLREAEVVAAYEASARSLAGVLRRVDGAQLASGACAMPYGTLPAGLVLQLAVMEAGVHASDLAATADADDSLSPSVVAASTTVLAATLVLLAGAGEGPDPSGTSVAFRSPSVELGVRASDEGWALTRPDEAGPPTVTISGSDTDVILFVLGRRTVDEVDLAGDRDVAARFKRWFPGP